MRLATQLEVDVLAVKARRQEESGRALLATDSHPARASGLVPLPTGERQATEARLGRPGRGRGRPAGRRQCVPWA
jgi:hypothetical protein